MAKSEYKIRNEVACCGHYVQCSDAGHCVSTIPAIASACIYRSSLEAGSIFYGKNANTFRPDEYHAFCKKISELSPEEYSTLAFLADYCFRRQWLCGSLMLYRNNIISSLLGLGLFTSDTSPKNLLAYYDYHFLRSKVPESPGQITKEKLISKMISEYPDIVAELTDHLVLISFTLPNRPYFLEAYRDGIFKSASDVDSIKLPTECKLSFVGSV